MMKLALACGLALVGFSSLALAADKTDLTGVWVFEVDIGGQTGSPEFTLEQDGETLTGQYKGQFGEADIKGEVKDGEVKIAFELQPGAEAVYTGTIQDDGTIKGEADYAGQASGTWVGKRKKGE